MGTETKTFGVRGGRYGFAAALHGVLCVSLLLGNCYGTGAITSTASVPGAPTLTTVPNTHYDFVMRTSSTLVIKCPAGGSPSPTITFYRNDEVLSSGAVGGVNLRISQSDSSLTIGLVTGALAADQRKQINGWYSCLAANTGGSVTSDFSILAVTPPSFIKGPTDLTLPTFSRTTSQAMMHCQVSAAPPPNVTWFKDGAAISGVGMDKKSRAYTVESHPDYFLIITNLTATDVGLYTCSATNMFGSALSVKAQLTLGSETTTIPIPPAAFPVVTTPASSSIGVSITFSLSGFSLPVPTWYASGTQISASAKYKLTTRSTAATLLVNTPQVTDSGVYSVTVISFLGLASRINSTAVVAMAVTPTISFTSVTTKFLLAKTPRRNVTITCATAPEQSGGLNAEVRQGLSQPFVSLLNPAAPSYAQYLTWTSVAAITVDLSGLDDVTPGQTLQVEVRCSASKTLVQTSDVSIIESCDEDENWVLNGGPTSASDFWISGISSSHPAEGASIQTDNVTGEADFAVVHQVNSSASYFWYQNVAGPIGITSIYLRAYVRSTSPTAQERYPNLRFYALKSVTQSTLLLQASTSYTNDPLRWTYTSMNFSVPSGVTAVRVFLRTFDSGRYTHANSALFKYVCLKLSAPDVAPTLSGSVSKTMTKVLGESLTLPCAAIGFPRPQISWVTHFLTPSISLDGTLYVANITAADFGQNLTCVASNRIGVRNRSTQILQLQGIWSVWSPISCPVQLPGCVDMLLQRSRGCMPVGATCSSDSNSTIICCLGGANPTTPPTTPTAVPTTTPTEVPTTTPTAAPTTTPTAVPTTTPTAVPTTTPTAVPTATPTAVPTTTPTEVPTTTPTAVPATTPTEVPTTTPTAVPATTPTAVPTTTPTAVPTMTPTAVPTTTPTAVPTTTPTAVPTTTPTAVPTATPATRPPATTTPRSVPPPGTTLSATIPAPTVASSQVIAMQTTASTGPGTIPSSSGVVSSSITSATSGSTVVGATESSESDSSLYVVVGASAGGGVLLLSIIVIVIIVLARRGGHSKKSISSSALFDNTAEGGTVVLTKQGLGRDDSMVANPKYQDRTDASRYTLSPARNGTKPLMYNEIPASAHPAGKSNGTQPVRYVNRQGSSQGYVDMSHSAQQYDRPSPAPEQSKANVRGESGDAEYVEANTGGPVVMKPVALNPNSMLADSATYEHTTKRAAEEAEYAEAIAGGPAIIQPVALNPNTLATDRATYEAVTSGGKDPSPNFYEIDQ